VGAVTKAIRALDAGSHVEVDLDAASVRVQSQETADRLSAAIVEAGYAVKGSRTIVDA
jgi:copper chaperone CopZ